MSTGAETIEGDAGPAGDGSGADPAAAGPDAISPPPFLRAVTFDALALQRQQYETSAQATLAAIRAILGPDPSAGPGDLRQPLRRR